MKKFSPVAVAFVSSCLVFFHSNHAFAAVIDAGATPEDAALVPLEEPNDRTAAAASVIDATPEAAASVPSRRPRKLASKKDGNTLPMPVPPTPAPPTPAPIAPVVPPTDPTKAPLPFDTYDHVPEADKKFTLSSPDLKDGDVLSPAQLSGFYSVPGGQDESPALEWSGFPSETKSFVVTCYDPDSPTVSGFWHWVMYDVPVDVTKLPANAGNLPPVPGGLVLRNDAGFRGYLGAAAAVGHGLHRYQFVVTAMATEKIGIPIDKDSSPALLHAMMNNAGILGRGFLTGRFGR